MNQVLRQEKKFLLPKSDFYLLKGRLDKELHGDLYNGLFGYSVRSLYFDTVYNGDYYEKEDGVELRRKMRLRCYSPDSDFAMLEMKQKQGEMQYKRSLRLGRADAVLMTQGDYSPLLAIKGENEEFAMECYGLLTRRCYLPKVIVEYQRMAYVAKENRIRITLDSDVRATESSMDLFSPNLLMHPVMDASAFILEVKYNHFLLSYIKEMLNTVDRSELSVSKYYMARQSLRRSSI